MTFSKVERHAYALDKIQKNKKVVVSEIAEELQVAPETIRRDFAELEEQHLLTRVHGGAVKFLNLRKEPAFLRKMDMQKEAKRQIAKAAAQRISDGDIIAVDVGTTTVHIAEFVEEVSNVTVVTNSIAAAERFNLAMEEQRMTGKVILLGGLTNPTQSSVAGAMTLEWLDKMSIDKVFLSCGGIDSGIVYDYDLDESLVSSKMVEKSEQRILLADASKIKHKSFYTICKMTELTEVICNERCPAEWEVYNSIWVFANGGQNK